MKNCFKTLLAVVAVVAATGLSAQEDPKREIVIVDPFTYSGSIGKLACDNLRSAVMSGFSSVGRFDVVDALSDSRLSKLYENRSVEEAVNSENWQSDSEAAYKALGANKLLKGNFELLNEYTKRDDDGTLYYYSDVNFTLQVFDITNGAMVGSESYKYSELSSSSYADAFNDAMKKTAKDMQQFCNKHFPVASTVIELGESDKKGVLIDLWIAGGTEVGIAKGHIFALQLEKKIGPKTILQKICEVKAVEATEGATRCQIMDKKKSEEIKQAYADQKTIHVVLVRKAGDGFKNFGRGLGF